MHKQKLNKDQHERNVGAKVLEGAVCKFYNNTEEGKYCMCHICLENYEVQQKGQQFLRQSSAMFKLQIAKMKKFYQFLSAVDHKIYFKLQMPELLFFQNGQGKVLFRSKGQAFVAVSLTPEMRKQIANIFVDSRKQGNSQPLYGDTSVHIKYFQAVVPSYKHGLGNDNLENKPKHFTFHSGERESEEKVLYRAHSNPDTEVALIKLKNKGLDILSERQLRKLMKPTTGSNPLQDVEFIQSFVKPHDRESEFIFSEYLDYRKPQNSLMFNRSMIQMKTQVGLISKYSKDYIPIDLLQEYEIMLKDMAEEYSLYQTYKMVHYIELNRDVKVKRLNTVWFKDESKELNYFGVMQFQYEQNEKITTDLSNITELKDIMKTELTDLEKELLKTWDAMKKRKMHQYKTRLASEEGPPVDDELEQIKKQCQSRRIIKKQKAETVKASRKTEHY